MSKTVEKWAESQDAAKGVPKREIKKGSIPDLLSRLESETGKKAPLALRKQAARVVKLQTETAGLAAQYLAIAQDNVARLKKGELIDDAAAIIAAVDNGEGFDLGASPLLGVSLE